MTPRQARAMKVRAARTFREGLEVVVVNPHNLVLGAGDGLGEGLGELLVAALVGLPQGGLKLVGHQLRVEQWPEDRLAEGEPLPSDLVVEEDDDRVELLPDALGKRGSVLRWHIVQQRADPDKLQTLVCEHEAQRCG